MSPSNPAVPEDPNPAVATAPAATVAVDIEALKTELEAVRAQAT